MVKLERCEGDVVLYLEWQTAHAENNTPPIFVDNENSVAEGCSQHQISVVTNLV